MASATILVAEDEPGVRELVVDILCGAGYSVIVAGDADEALRILAERNGQIDLLLTDVRMPGLSGLELADEVVLAKPWCKVLYLTGYPDDLARMADPRLYGKLMWKPFQAAQLLEGVSKALA
jgi:CheY-like chemotaxis protein